ncbi:MAG: hypothetical protein ACLFUE_09965, partial [Desulfobacteraceae bacterium]
MRTIVSILGGCAACLLAALFLQTHAAEHPGVSLRSQPKDLSAEELSSLLLEYNFYATCWTYNVDFCNPNGEFDNDYVDNGDGTLTDRRTGLMWQKGGSSEPLSWATA